MHLQPKMLDQLLSPVLYWLISVMTSGRRILFGACGQQRNQLASYIRDQGRLTELFYSTEEDED